jgi:hypothetical protein
MVGGDLAEPGEPIADCAGTASGAAERAPGRNVMLCWSQYRSSS